MIIVNHMETCSDRLISASDIRFASFTFNCKVVFRTSCRVTLNASRYFDRNTTKHFQLVHYSALSYGSNFPNLVEIHVFPFLICVGNNSDENGKA